MVYITADTHGDIDRLTDKKLKKIKIGDTLIVLGDFGFLWSEDKNTEKNLKKIRKLPFRVLFIDGYNENFEVLAKYPSVEFKGAKAREIIPTKLYYIERGEIIDIDDYRILFFGGRDDPTDDFFSDYIPSQKDFDNCMNNLEKADFKVDYVLTHSPSGNTERFLNLDHTRMGNTFDFLDNIQAKTTYGKWYFGYYHRDKYISSKLQAVFEDVIKLGE